MFRRTIGAAIAAAAVVGAASLIRSVLEENHEEADDDKVNFINIEDDSREYPEEIKEIAGLYPYLDKEFIAEQFARNDAFRKEYPEDTLIDISHKARFPEARVLQEFLKIADDNGYVSEPLSETESIISKKMFTTDGAILSDIYNVANQVACLKGIYEGYKID